MRTIIAAAAACAIQACSTALPNSDGVLLWCIENCEGSQHAVDCIRMSLEYWGPDTDGEANREQMTRAMGICPREGGVTP